MRGSVFEPYRLASRWIHRFRYRLVRRIRVQVDVNDRLSRGGRSGNQAGYGGGRAKLQETPAVYVQGGGCSS